MKKGERMKKLIIAVALTVGVQNIAHADLQNMGFENGNLTHWTLTPSYIGSYLAAEVKGSTATSDFSKNYSAPQGSYFVELSAGASDDDGAPLYTVLQRTITINATQSIAGWAAFLAEDDTDHNDNAYVRIYDTAGDNYIIWSKDVAAVGEYRYSEWEYWTWKAPKSGVYTLEYGVTNETDNFYNSRALFDAVPAPNTLLLLGSGLLGLVGIRRKLQ